MNMIDILWNKFPYEFGRKRVFVKTKDELYALINRCNGKIDCYISLYTKIENPRIDKIYFDLDSKQCWTKTKQLHKYLVMKDLKHCVMFSGGGFHFYVFTNCPLYAEESDLNYPKNAIRLVQQRISKKAGLKIGKSSYNDIDEHIIGDVRRISRLPYTFNVKPNRRRFCIPITASMFDLEHISHIELLAEKQNLHLKEECIFGNDLIDLRQYDKKPDITYLKLDEKDIKVDKKKITTHLQRLPPLIRNMLINCKCGWRERYYTILAMKELGFPINLCIEICRKYWTPQKFCHAMRDEHQIEYIYRRSDLFFPKWRTLEEEGYQISNEDNRFCFYRKED